MTPFLKGGSNLGFSFAEVLGWYQFILHDYVRMSALFIVHKKEACSDILWAYLIISDCM